MPHDQGGRKICVLCGADCAGRPRKKDSRGHYYCRDCHDAAAASARRRAGEATPVGGLALLNELVPADDATGNPVDAGFHLDGLMCPRCHAPVERDAALCVACGADLRTGGRVAARTRVTDGDDAADTLVWPMIIGVISIVFGGTGLLLNGGNGVLVALNPGPAGAPNGTSEYAVGQIAGAAIATLLSLWLLVGGIGLVRRRARAIENLRRWAGAKIILLFIAGTCIGIAFGVSGLDGRPGRAASINDALPLGLGLLIALFAWQLAWPVFILAWSGRSAVQREVRSWDD